MEEESTHSEEFFFIPESNIRSVEKNIKDHLKKFEKGISNGTYLETAHVCEAMKKQILNYKDEPFLSKTYNNCRRIVIASELFISICSAYDHFVDYEFTKTVSDLVQREKFDKLSKAITQSLKLQLKRQKYFAREAQDMLVKRDAEERASGNAEIENREKAAKPTENGEAESILLQRTEQIPGTVTEVVEKSREILSQSEIPPVEQELAEAPKRTQLHETLDDIMSYVSGSLSQIRAEPMGDSLHAQDFISNSSRDDVMLPDTLAGASIGDISQILKALEDGNEPGEIEKPENEDVVEKIIEVPKDSTTGKEIEELEESEEWYLPTLEPVETKKQQRHLKIDEKTFIHDYAKKALQLNRNIQVERVQVYEGPPEILEAMSVTHLMTRPGYKISLFNEKRSSKLNKLYERHLIVDKKPVENVILRTRATVQQKNVDNSAARTNVDILEELEVPAGLRSELERTDILAEIAPAAEKVTENLETSALGPHSRDSLAGVPVSRIISGTVPTPKPSVERITIEPNLPVSRVHELQGKDLEPRTSPPWFFSTKENPPSEKYREFSYVHNKLQEYWFFFECQGMEKCITLSDFFSFEKDDNFKNVLTVLRIVDKMSIQRKLLLEYKNSEVFIRPFETPYVSERQMRLKGKMPVL